MRAVWYEAYGPAREVLKFGELEAPEPGAGEVRVRLRASGANPSDYKARLGSRGEMRWPRIIPHSDGAGAVGRYGVQLAKWGGASVIATVSGEEKARVAREAGADHVVNYREEDVAERVMAITGGEGVDRICEVDFGENLEVARRALKENGTVAAYGSTRVPEPTLPWYRMMPGNTAIRMVFVYSMPEAAVSKACADINAACEAGALTHHVGARFPLEETAAAHELMENFGNLGNVVVEMD